MISGSGRWISKPGRMAAFTWPIFTSNALTTAVTTRDGSIAPADGVTITEAVGRWSMIDVFMISILVALVKLGAIATIEPGAGAMAFAAVVVITMFAAMSFDPRLIWDALENPDER